MNGDKQEIRSELQYGKGYISGKVSSDKFCLNNHPEEDACQ